MEKVRMKNDLNIVLNKLTKKLKIIFKGENTGHDFSHLSRVFENAKEIQEKEGGDIYVVLVSALVHDMHRIIGAKLGRYVEPKDSLDETKKILIECDVDKDKIEKILKIVEFHEDKTICGVSLETQIVQDADALDAIGEIGLKRTLQFCKVHKIPLYNKNVPLDCKEYMPNTNPISTCHYVYRTMIPQVERLHTMTAKEIARPKLKIMENFLEQNLGGKGLIL